ncbi:histone chaperone ASF1-like [Panonychus citri]|uniref:histone chaperone ASF1-like n=1 Tax=Panonychus citri TaxID=50023 RepID=UPI0023078736|nr:histone chaperone ASF1-like [Panonychus citri]
MAKVHLINVVVLDNPAAFDSPFQFEITFECLEDLKEDLEWKLIYVGSADSEEYDQILDCVYVGPVPEGRHMFLFQADPPDPSKIPVQDAVGVTVILLSCSYRSKEFIRVGYYINNEYTVEELKENPPAQPEFDKLQRNILATYPRVTRFKIDWCDAVVSEENGGDKPEENGADEEEELMDTMEMNSEMVNEGNNGISVETNSDANSEMNVEPNNEIISENGNNHEANAEIINKSELTLNNIDSTRTPDVTTELQTQNEIPTS